MNANETRAMNDETRRILSEARQITDSFQNTIAPASDMKASVSIMRNLELRALPPGEVMHPIGRTLDRHPRIDLDELGWKMEAAAPDPTPSALPAQVVSIKGRLQGFGHDYRAALGYLDRFQHDLEKEGYLITPVSKPLDLSPGGTLSDQRDARQEALAFELKLTRRATE
jgi:hypothetical protein